VGSHSSGWNIFSVYRIGSDGLRALAEALITNNTLDELDFSHNTPTDAAVEYFMDLLKDNRGASRAFGMKMAWDSFGAKEIVLTR
jgi:hypothetical protein